jgi:hypothetical protein
LLVAGHGARLEHGFRSLILGHSHADQPQSQRRCPRARKPDRAVDLAGRARAELADDIVNPIVCEIGGGFGGCAYHLLRYPNFRYIDYDIPVMCIVSAYYLMTAYPHRELRLFGEVASLAEPVSQSEIAILPNYVLPHLNDLSVDICFNTCSFAEMDIATVQEYTRQFESVCRKFILYEDHSWTGDSKYAYYQPMGGFQHWNLSAIEPSK